MLVREPERGFECMVSAYQHRIYAFGLSLTGNSQDGEDVAQDAFVRAHRALLGYPAERVGELRLSSWLHQIALNVFRNRVRGRRLETVPLGDREMAGDLGQPEPEAERSEVRRVLIELLGRLPVRHREAVVLRHVQGMTYGEAAKVLGQPVGTVKANVHRGLSRLRRDLQAMEVMGEAGLALSGKGRWRDGT